MDDMGLIPDLEPPRIEGSLRFDNNRLVDEQGQPRRFRISPANLGARYVDVQLGPLRGQLLISSPEMSVANLSRTVQFDVRIVHVEGGNVFDLLMAAGVLEEIEDESEDPSSGRPTDDRTTRPWRRLPSPRSSPRRPDRGD